MAKTDEAGEYKRPDAAKAFDIYDKQIVPKEAHMATLKGDMSQPYADIKEHANYPRSVLNFINKLRDMDEAKRDHHLLALREGLSHCKLFLPRDLFTGDGEEAIPTGDREDGELLVDAAEDDEGDDFEAAPEELAKQEGRPKRRTARQASVSNVTPLH